MNCVQHCDLLFLDFLAAPMRDEASRLLGVVLVFRDIAEERRAEVALRASEAAGCDGQLVKPVNLPDLEKMLDELA